jgi:hypothetical protein
MGMAIPALFSRGDCYTMRPRRANPAHDDRYCQSYCGTPA